MTAWITISLRTAAALAVLAIGAGLAGCETPLERAWGISYHAHNAQSIVNPDAGSMHDRAAQRPDGRSTDAALTKWRTKEMEVAAPEPPPVINIDAQ